MTAPSTTSRELVLTPEAVERTGATTRKADWWIRTGITSCARPARGSGSRRGFDAADLFVLRALATTSAAMGGTDVSRRVLITVAAEARRYTLTAPDLAAPAILTFPLSEFTTLTVRVPGDPAP